jgi:hypothetical protein
MDGCPVHVGDHSGSAYGQASGFRVERGSPDFGFGFLEPGGGVGEAPGSFGL